MSTYLKELDTNEDFQAFKTAKKELATQYREMASSPEFKAAALFAAVQENCSTKVAKKIREWSLKNSADIEEQAPAMKLSEGFIAAADKYTKTHAKTDSIDTYQLFRAEKKAYKATMSALFNSGVTGAQLKEAFDGKDLHRKVTKKVDYWQLHNWKLS